MPISAPDNAIAATSRGAGRPIADCRQHFFRGTLLTSPFKGEFYQAQTKTLPMEDEQDYCSVGAYENPVTDPVLLSYYHYYVLLENIVNAAFTELGELDFILLRCIGPLYFKVPPLLLDKRVLFVDDVSLLLPGLLDIGRKNVLTVRDTLRRDCNERGDNRIDIDLYTDRCTTEQFHRFLLATRFHAFAIESPDRQKTVLRHLITESEK